MIQISCVTTDQKFTRAQTLLVVHLLEKQPSAPDRWQRMGMTALYLLLAAEAATVSGRW